MLTEAKDYYFNLKTINWGCYFEADYQLNKRYNENALPNLYAHLVEAEITSNKKVDHSPSVYRWITNGYELQFQL